MRAHGYLAPNSTTTINDLAREQRYIFFCKIIFLCHLGKVDGGFEGFILAEENNEYGQKALDVGRKLTELAPTDPQSYYTLAQIQAGVGKTDEAKKTLETALSLKADYLEAQELLKQLTFDN